MLYKPYTLKNYHKLSKLKALSGNVLSDMDNEIRQQLKPHPAGQLECNIPEFEGNRLNGIQHKYDETMLVFPSKGQTCHAYCTFCFRWPQFTGMSDYKILLNQPQIPTMWVTQVNLGLIPYYMFIPRNTGSQRFFSLPLVKSYDIFQKAFSNVSGLARTVRGPSMSALHGKIGIDGISTINGKDYIAMSLIQARSSEWVKRPFFAEYDDTACWINELKPAFHDAHFFFEDTQRSTEDLESF